MAVSVIFYKFSKKHNSTAIPSAPLLTMQCSIKEESSVLTPTLQISLSLASTNPTIYNYCYIAAFSRYYWITDWTYISGYWEVSLRVDVLATYKTEIGNSSKYILRASSRNNPSVIDNFYPALNSETEIIDTYDFNFDVSSGDYVLGIVNRQDTNIGGMVSYYRVTETILQDLRTYMYPTASEAFEDITTLTGDILRAAVDPWQYIISCRKFPISIPSDAIQSRLRFGQWAAGNCVGWRLSALSSWGVLTHDFTIQNWLNLDAKYRSYPNCHIYLHINPWGVIPLSPLDFTNSNTVRIKIKTDFITGESLLEVYNVKAFVETLIAQRTALIGIDTHLSATTFDSVGILAGLGGVAAGIATGGAAGIIAAGGSILSAADSAIPSMSASSGETGGFRAIEGVATLIVRYLNFAPDNNAEFGKPLCDTVQINTLSGYIQCADGDIAVSAFDSELTELSEFLTSGFFYD